MKKLLTVAAAGVTVLAVGACSGGGSTAIGTSSTTAAPRPGDVVQASSFTPRLQSAMKGARTMHVVMTTDAGGSSAMTAEGDVSKVGGIAEHLTMKLGAMSMELVLKNQAMYLKSETLPLAGKWLVVKEGGTDPLSRQLAPLFKKLGSMQPDQQVASYAVGDQKVVGQETVDGVATTHYTSSPSAAQISRGISENAELGGLVSGTDLSDITVDMWVDGGGLPHKVVAAMKLKGKPVTMTVRVSKVGEPVTITAPPAAQTTTAP